MEQTQRQNAPRQVYDAAWPDLFASLQTAYAELTRAQFALERRTAEMEAGRDLFYEVIESMSEAWLLIDRAGRVERANPAAAALLECDEAELVGRPFAEIGGSDTIPITPWQLLERAPNGRLTHFDAELTTQTGRLVPISISVGLVRDRRGKIIGMQMVANDITARKQAEAILARQAEDLARSNTVLEQFTYVASHDLQEPSRMMASFAQRSSKHYKAELDADADEFIDYIVDGAPRWPYLGGVRRR